MSTATLTNGHANGNGKTFTFGRVTTVLTLIALFITAWTGYIVTRSDANKLAQELAAKAAVERAKEIEAAEALGAKRAMETLDHEKTKSTIDLVQSQVIPSLTTLNSSMGTLSAVVSKHSDGLTRIETLLKIQGRDGEQDTRPPKSP